MCSPFAAVFAQAQKETGEIHGTAYGPTTTIVPQAQIPARNATAGISSATDSASLSIPLLSLDQYLHGGRARGSALGQLALVSGSPGSSAGQRQAAILSQPNVIPSGSTAPAHIESPLPRRRLQPDIGTLLTGARE
jgi:hypothetical protein